MRLPLFIDTERQLLVGGLNDPSPASLPKLKQGDDLEIILQAVVKQDSTVVQYYRAVPLAYTTIKCAITTGPDAPPIEGTIRVALAGGTAQDVTGTFGPDITKPALAELLNALPTVQAKGGVAVLTANVASNIFRVRWLNPAETARFEFRENLLEPPCDLRYETVGLPNGQVQLLKYRQQPLAFTDDFALPSVPPVTAASVRVGTGTGNCIQAIAVPSDAVGSVHFVFASLATVVLPVASLSVSSIAAALNSLYTDGVTRFSVTRANSTVYYVQFVGPLALTNFPVLGVEMHDQEPPQTPTAKLPLNWASLEMALDGQKEITLLFEIEITDDAGKVGTPIQMPVTIVNDAIDGGMALVGQPPWQQPGSPTYVPPNSDEPTIVAPGAYVTPVGAGTAVGTSGRDFVVTHNLGTSNVLVGVRETGGTHLRVPDDQYTCVILNDNQVEVIFALPPTLNQYYVVIAAVIPATMGLPHHTHPIADVQGLQAILDALKAGGNPLDLWPNIPDSKLPTHISWRNADGTFRFDKLPTELLPDGVPFIGPDGGLYVILPGPPPVTIQILDPTGHIPVGTLPTDPSQWPGLVDAILAALQSGATLPNTVVFTLPDYAESFPPAFALSNHCPEDTTLATVPASLLPALFNTPLAGNVSGGLPPPASAGYAGKRFNVVGSASSPADIYRDEQVFRHGAVIASNGFHWYAVTTSGNTAYPQEYERELFSLYVSGDMLAKGSHFAVDFTLQAQLTSPDLVRGQCLLTLEIGQPQGVTGAGIGANLSQVDWYSQIVQETLILSNANVYHHFAYAVSADATTGAYKATRSLYAATGLAAPAPANPGFAVRATLRAFDVENTPPNPTGAINLKMLKALASVVKLSS